MSVRERIDRFGDPALALALTAGIELEAWFDSPQGMTVRGGQIALALVAVGVTLPLGWRRRAPLAVLIAALVAFAAALALITHARGTPLSALIAFGVAFYSVGAHAESRRAIAGGSLGLAAVAAIDYLGGGVFQSVGGVRPGTWLILALCWQAGREVRRKRLELSGLRAHAAALEQDREEKARLAAAQERARIARELHDVVAHSVSVMVVQAQAADRVLEGEEPAARELLGSIETTGRQALSELRRLLGLLRRFEGADLAPQPSLRHIEGLVAQMRDAGLPVDLVVQGEELRLSPGLDLSAYRIVQEGLTNALKHAGRARARVVVRYAPGEIQLEVADDGRGDGDGGGAGQGLVGMRERVAMYGGELESGPADGGGYVLRARLPVGADA
ncbi:MAG TPA: histidine kinase [Gaiellales bacterium]|jgi:signal transduction histidine kinase